MHTRPVVDSRELAALAEVAAPLQARSDAHIGYLGLDVEGIAAELAETTWNRVSAVIADDGVITGWLIGDVDPEMGRVWWFGPFVASGDWESVATSLLMAGRAQLDRNVTEEEIAVDSAFERCRAWAPQHGFVEATCSFVLTLDQPIPPASLDIREIAERDHEAVAALHDELFAGSHTTGHDLVNGHDATHRRLVVDLDGGVAGYVAVERQPDGMGYIDFVGVAPAARRRGLGSELIRAGAHELGRLDATPVALTVRDDIVGARELYASLGFREERALVPLRRGFPIA